MAERAITVAHVIHRFDVGGLENGLVQLINQSSDYPIFHHVIALTRITDVSERIHSKNVQLHELNKRPGKDPACYFRLLRVLRRIRPDVVHTRNWGTLDCVPIARMAGVRVVFHGEHGWDVNDPEGDVWKYRLMRRVVGALVERFVPLSQELEQWLQKVVKIDASRIYRICNGVDVDRFRPRGSSPPGRRFVVGTVTRFDVIKNPLAVIDCFTSLIDGMQPVDCALLMVGDGPLLGDAKRLVRERGLDRFVSFVGRQLDVAPFLQEMDVFVLTSKREGISNTILEAMATGLPVVARDTGGNPELIEPGQTGVLIDSDDPADWAAAVLEYKVSRDRAVSHGLRARMRAEEEFSIAQMVGRYLDLYGVSMETVS